MSNIDAQWKNIVHIQSNDVSNFTNGTRNAVNITAETAVKTQKE